MHVCVNVLLDCIFCRDAVHVFCDCMHVCCVGMCSGCDCMHVSCDGVYRKLVWNKFVNQDPPLDVAVRLPLNTCGVSVEQLQEDLEERGGQVEMLERQLASQRVVYEEQIAELRSVLAVRGASEVPATDDRLQDLQTSVFSAIETWYRRQGDLLSVVCCHAIFPCSLPVCRVSVRLFFRHSSVC